MAQVMKGSPSLKQAPAVAASRAGSSSGSGGMVVGAVINKPMDRVAVPGGVPTGAPTNPVMQSQLPPGIIALNPQQPVPPPPQQQPQQQQTQHVLPVQPNNSTSPTMNTLANTKEKTPMCLINELARFNKIQHQYTLTDEQGPAHKKTFFVKLKLGDEEYSASGASIKKAQHAAADIALEQTQYKHPPPKPPRGNMDGSGRWDSDSITPTVELNALAMKRGEPAVYHPIDVGTRQPHPPPHPPQFYPPANMDFRGMYNQRYHYPRAPSVFYVSLKVGSREFVGEGRTRQAARHAAAEKALKVLRNLPLPSAPPASSSVSNAKTPSQGTPEKDGDQGDSEEGDTTDGLNGLLDQKDALKSEISLVHEIALKRNMPVSFEVTRESGPPHMRTFLTRCTCGELVCEADGNSKKLSKKRAAEKMLLLIRELPGLPPTAAPTKPKKNQNNKKKNRNLIKVEKATPDYGVGINPISRLIQIQQAKKEKEPVYTLSAERGLPRRREFVIQVSVGEQSCTGVGPNKKLAKRNAAEAMLQLLGYSRPAPQPSKPAIKTATSASQSPPPSAGSVPDKKVTFLDSQAPSSRQLVPGVILMSDVQRAQANAGGGAYVVPAASDGQSKAAGHQGNSVQSADVHNVTFSPQTTAAIAKELLDTGASPTAEAISKTVPATSATTSTQSTVRPKQQLLYLAGVLGFGVSFTDFPKGTNREEFLSLVSLSTNPPQMIHGSGASIEASHDVAAHKALLTLAEAGLDTVVTNNTPPSQSASSPPAPAPATAVSPASDGCKPSVIVDGKASGDGPHVVDDVKKANSGSDKIKVEAK